MPRKSKKSKSAKKGGATDEWLFVDPARVRFQHSKIRPYFSGCGISVQGTLESIRRKEIKPEDLPPIQVIVGPEAEDGPWYFSLNNRRLWVLKRCREEGLLENNSIRVRVRAPKSESEMERYTLENCAVEAKFLREKQPGQVQLETTRLESKTNGGLSPPANEWYEGATESLEAAVMKIEIKAPTLTLAPTRAA